MKRLRVTSLIFVVILAVVFFFASFFNRTPMKKDAMTPQVATEVKTTEAPVCHDKSYTVVAGDTLSGIANRETVSRENLYRLVAMIADKSNVENQNLIYPDQVLVIPCDLSKVSEYAVRANQMTVVAKDETSSEVVSEEIQSTSVVEVATVETLPVVHPTTPETLVVTPAVVEATTVPVETPAQIEAPVRTEVLIEATADNPSTTKVVVEGTAGTKTTVKILKKGNYQVVVTNETLEGASAGVFPATVFTGLVQDEEKGASSSRVDDTVATVAKLDDGNYQLNVRLNREVSVDDSSIVVFNTGRGAIDALPSKLIAQGELLESDGNDEGAETPRFNGKVYAELHELAPKRPNWFQKSMKFIWRHRVYPITAVSGFLLKGPSGAVVGVIGAVTVK